MTFRRYLCCCMPTRRVNVKTLWFCFGVVLIIVVCTELIKIQQYRYGEDVYTSLKQIVVVTRKDNQVGLDLQDDNKKQVHPKVLHDDPNVNSRWPYRKENRSMFLTIGIPSIRRHNTNRVYLHETLQSIIDSTNDKDRARTRVLVFLTDNNNTYNIATERVLRARFSSHVADGFVNITIIPPGLYPDLENVRRTFNDSKERVQWRSKQNLDFSYMFWYSRFISQYYMQLEDDVITTKDFVSQIDSFIQNQTKPWFLLEFSNLGFIGKLFKSRDLTWMSSVLYKRYAFAPCDLLLGALRKARKQIKPIHSNISLFQHIGKFSSLKHKLMPALDRTFKDLGKGQFSPEDYPKGDNPPVKLFKTNIQQYENNQPEFTYDGDMESLFWGKSPKAQDYFTLVFESPHNLSRVLIVTGHPIRRIDILLTGELHYSHQKSLDNPDECGPFKKLASFIDGEVDTLAQGLEIVNDITCLKIIVKKRPKTWLIIWRIEVFSM